MKVMESDRFKISLVNDLNNQRVNGINYDIEIDSSISTCKIYTHSIILNLFSDILKAFIENKMRDASMSIYRIKFPDELDFMKTNCFDCFKQVINYFYAGELSVDPEHETHLKNIVFNLNIKRLIQLLFTNFEENDALSHRFDFSKSTIENEKSQPSTKLSSECIPTLDTRQVAISKQLNDGNNTNGGTNLKINSKPYESIQDTHDTDEINLDQRSKAIIQSPMKKRLRENYERTMNNSDTCTTDFERNNHSTEQIHSDGLHLLLSILEEENRKEFLVPESNLLTSSQKCLSPYEFNNSHQPLSQETIVETRETIHTEDSILCQALVSNKHKEEVDQEQISSTENVVLNEPVNGPTENDEREINIKRKRRRKIMKNEENCAKRKKKENQDKVTGEQDGYICKKCKMFFDNLSLFQEHLQSTHSKKFKCIACNFVTYKIRCFIDHLIQNRHEGKVNLQRKI